MDRVQGRLVLLQAAVGTREALVRGKIAGRQ